jgi:hypothetical protein
MATRSRIAVELSDGTVKSVYCHWDGYPSGVGRDLLDMEFSSTKEVEDFINEGDRSTVNLSYAKWRGEDCPPQTHASVSDFFDGDIEEYGYLFNQEEEWILKVVHRPYSDLIKLADLAE